MLIERMFNKLAHEANGNGKQNNVSAITLLRTNLLKIEITYVQHAKV